jgi:hypothetical protein
MTEGGAGRRNVDRIRLACLWKPLISAHPEFFSLLFLHALPGSLIIAVTALAGTRVMNRMSVGGAAAPGRWRYGNAAGR